MPVSAVDFSANRMPGACYQKRILSVKMDFRITVPDLNVYSAKGFQGKIGFISAVSHAFCDSCNRLRLTSEGFLKSCLYYDTGADLRPALEEGPEALKAAFREAVEKKPLCHNFRGQKDEEGREETDHRDGRRMSQIGG